MNNMRRPKTKIAVTAMVLVCISSLPTMAANKLIVKDAAGTTDKFVVTDTGRIGSGTAIPASAFHAQGKSYDTTQVITHWNGTLAQYGGGGFVGLYNNDNNALPLKKDRLGYFLFGSMNQGSKLIGGGINVNAEQNWTGSSAPTYISFLTAADGSTTMNERVRITGSGNVGVGAFSPSQKLEVNGGVRLNYAPPQGTPLTKPTCNATIRGTLWFEQGTTDTLWVCAQAGGSPFWRAVTLQ